MRPANDPGWLIPGGVFAAIVIGLLMWLHGATPDVPRLPEVDTVEAKGVHVCTPTTDAWAALWVGDTLESALWRADALGYSLEPTSSGPCELCDHDDGLTECMPGRIALTLRDQAFDPDHLGETRLHVVDGVVTWGTVLLPATLDVTTDPDDERDLPHGLASLVLGHEMICHTTGHGHVRTEIAGGVHAVPTGHLCAPTVWQLGDDTEGVPRGD